MEKDSALYQLMDTRMNGVMNGMRSLVAQMLELARADNIAESIVMQHKGKIWVESRNSINTFYVELLLAEKSQILYDKKRLGSSKGLFKSG